MVNKNPRKAILINILIILLIVNLFLHVLIFGTGIRGVLQTGVSQILLGNKLLSISAFSDMHPGLKIASFCTIVLELALLFFVSFRKKQIKKETNQDLNTLKRLRTKYSKMKNQTELDVLYNILKEKKKVDVSNLHHVFDVDKDTVKEWIETLESGDLAELNDKKLGEPELILKK